MEKKFVFFGECMLELKGQAFGQMQQGFGGDTLNSAVYLSRCSPPGAICTYYATALGDDALSAQLLARWQREGVDVSLVQRKTGQMPGLYLITLDPAGERSFHYWREQSAAKAFFEDSATMLESQQELWDGLYVSGISLAILPEGGRQRLFDLMAQLRRRGAMVAFDNNYRPRLWDSAANARRCFERAFALSTLALVTADDHQLLFGLHSEQKTLAHIEALPCFETVVKRGARATLVRCGQGHWIDVPVQAVSRVVDTTAAGDSFAGGYLSRRLLGVAPEVSAAFGNELAARVIQHSGALIEQDHMLDLMAPLAAGSAAISAAISAP